MTPETVRIDRLGHAGDGIAQTAEGGQIAIPDALPGETFAAPSAGPATWTLTGPASVDRVPPPCAHFGECGGCSAQHMSPRLYSAWKRGLLVTALRQHGLTCEVEALVTVAPGSRRRASFSIATSTTGGTGEQHPGFHALRSDRVIPLRECTVLTPAIIAALPALAAMARTLAPWPQAGRMAVADLDGGLDVAIEEMKPSLSAATRARIADIATRFRLARVTIADNPVVERATVTLLAATARVTPPPGAFFQAVREAEKAMSDRVVAAVGKARRVADLFCGLGTFTFALGLKARVLAIDSDRALLDALADAARRTPGLKPIEVRLRDLFRDPLSPRELDGLDAVVLDPPRSGAKAQSEALAKSKVATVVCVSCNPATLARDLGLLTAGGYRIERVTPIDQFLYAPHLEAVAVLRR